MEYKIGMHTVVETPSYLRKAESLFSRAEMDAIVREISANPAAGDLMQGTGGFRKLRAGRGNMGKRGGARVIYIHRSEAFPVFLVTVFAKNEKSNLTAAERNALKRLSDEIFAAYEVKG